MDLRADEAQPLDQAVTFHGAVGRREFGARVAIGDVLQYADVLGECLAAVERERRNVTLRVHLVEIESVGGLLGVPVDLDQLKLKARLPQRNVGGQRTSPG